MSGLVERGPLLGREVERVDVVAPEVEDLGPRLVGREPAHDLGRLDQRVVGAERHRAVAGRAPHAQAAPRRRPSRPTVIVTRLAAIGAHHEPARLGEHVVGGDRVALVVERPLGTPLAAGFLVGDGEVDQRRPRGRKPLPSEVLGGDGHRRGEVEHVDGAAPHTSPSTSSPPNGSRCHPLGVTGTTSVWPMRHSVGAVGSEPSMRATSERAARRRARSPRGRHRRPRGSRAAGRRCAPRRPTRGAVVDALVADELLQQLGHFAGELVGHGPMLRPGDERGAAPPEQALGRPADRALRHRGRARRGAAP